MKIKSWMVLIMAVIFSFRCTALFGEGNRGAGDITGKWELKIYDKMNRLNTLFIKEFREDLTYIYVSTLYKRQGGVAQKSQHEGTYVFGPVDKTEPGFPGEKAKGKTLYRLTRRMNKKDFVFTRYVQFVDENTMWIWGKAPGLAGLHKRIGENKQ